MKSKCFKNHTIHNISRCRFIFLFAMVAYLLLFIQCKKQTYSNEDRNPTIEIKTDKNIYSISENIATEIVNKTANIIYHFKCDNVNIAPDRIEKFQNNSWFDLNYYVVCTAMGPAGYFGNLLPTESISDTILISKSGIYRLKYKFIIELDTVICKSNKFQIE